LPARFPSAFGCGAVLPTLLLLGASPAHAQVSATIGLVSDDRLRARTVSNGEPVVTVDVSFDDPSGFYLAAGAAASVQDSEPTLTRGYANLGYAHRLDSGSILDAGVLRTEYSGYLAGGGKAHYTDFYAGLLRGNLALYAHYSPDYLRPDMSTLYLEASGVVELDEAWRLSGKVGMLTRLTQPAATTGSRVEYDWRVGVTRSLGPAEAELALSDGGPDDEFYDGRRHDRLALTATLTWSL
jgi:uncharacterized protein (TIGR02001 family)